MKITLLRCLPLIGALALAGCASSGNVTIPNPFSTTPITVTPAQVQAAAVSVCGFQPTIDSVVNVETNNGQNAATAEAIAALICKAVAGGKHRVAGRRLGAAVTKGYVNGVPISGSFVR